MTVPNTQRISAKSGLFFRTVKLLFITIGYGFANEGTFPYLLFNAKSQTLPWQTWNLQFWLEVHGVEASPLGNRTIGCSVHENIQLNHWVNRKDCLDADKE